jgi:hypothetical protein
MESFSIASEIGAVMHILVYNTSNSPPARIPLMLSRAAVTPTILFLSLLSIIIYSRLIIETRSHSDVGEDTAIAMILVSKSKSQTRLAGDSTLLWN